MIKRFIKLLIGKPKPVHYETLVERRPAKSNTMKNLFLLLILIIPASLHAQLYVDFGGGMETSAGRPIANISVGFQHSNVIVEAVEQVTISRVANNTNLFGLKAGYNYKNFIPAVGYYYNYRSSDNKEMNHAAAGFSLKYFLNLNPNGGLYAEAMYVEKVVQVTAGFHVTF